jgi:NAD(P)-dependent dehydrogenase (short-subunit alcohol dehydrogenase family)
LETFPVDFEPMTPNTAAFRPVSIVSGAGRGIGLGIARALARSGRQVALTDIDAPSAEREAQRLRDEGHDAIAAQLDVSRSEEWTRVVGLVVEHWGGIDILVNNAGISPRGTIDATDAALWERTLGINLNGPWHGIKACLPHLRARGGTVVNIGSTHSVLPMKGMFAYCVSKSALLGLTRQVAVECLDEVTCNLIAPGWVASPGEMSIQEAAGRPDFPNGIRNMSSAEDVGEAVVYLVSHAARRMTGSVLYLDGGLHVVGDVDLIHMPNSGW